MNFLLSISCIPLTEQGSPTVSINRSFSISDNHDNNRTEEDVGSDTAGFEEQVQSINEHHELDDEEFGDDFDDFEEGGDGDDFGDFDDGFQQGEESSENVFEKPPDPLPVPDSLPGLVSQIDSIPTNAAPMHVLRGVMRGLT